MFKIGKVTHYYDKVGMALVELDGTLAVGDKIKFVFDHTDLFTQIVNIIQVGHEKVGSASRGNMVLLKTNEVVKTATEIFKES